VLISVPFRSFVGTVSVQTKLGNWDALRVRDGEAHLLDGEEGKARSGGLTKLKVQKGAAVGGGRNNINNDQSVHTCALDCKQVGVRT
jgi:hypothetical protein